MSFQEGWRAGLNLYSQIKANERADRQEERADRQEERQAKLDKRQKKIDRINREAAKPKQKVATRDLREQQRVKREKATSQSILGYYYSKANQYDFDKLEDVEEYETLFSHSYSQIKDPEVLTNLNMIDKSFREKAAYKSILDDQAAKYKDKLKLKEEVREINRDRGTSYSIDNPKDRQEVLGISRFMRMEKDIMAKGISYEAVGMDPTKGKLTPDEFISARALFNGELAKQQQLKTASASAAQTMEVSRLVEQAQKDGQPIADVMTLTGLGKDLSVAEGQELDGAFAAIELTRNVEDRLQDLDLPTGKFLGPAVATLNEVLQTDAGMDSEAFKAAVTQLIPKYARGIMGEVGVLTNEDIKNYAATVASLDNSPGSNKKIMAVTKVFIHNALRNKVRRLVGESKNVKGYAAQYAAFAARNTPVIAYLSVDQMEKKMAADIKSGDLKVDDTYTFWNGNSMVTKTLEKDPTQPQQSPKN